MQKLYKWWTKYCFQTKFQIIITVNFEVAWINKLFWFNISLGIIKPCRKWKEMENFKSTRFWSTKKWNISDRAWVGRWCWSLYVLKLQSKTKELFKDLKNIPFGKKLWRTKTSNLLPPTSPYPTLGYEIKYLFYILC